MPSPNAFYYPSSLVLVRDSGAINNAVNSPLVLVESRRVDNGIYFHFTTGHTLADTIEYSILASPLDAPRSSVDTYIV